MLRGRFLGAGIAALLVVSTVLSGCGFIAKKAVEGTTGVSVNQKGDQVTVKGQDGQQVTINSKVPDQLKDFPVPQGFKIDSGGSMSSGGDMTAVATWKGSSTISAVVDFYKKTMPDKGYQETLSFSDDNGGSLIYTKGNDSITIAVSKSGSDTEISVIQGKSKS